MQNIIGEHVMPIGVIMRIITAFFYVAACNFRRNSERQQLRTEIEIGIARSLHG